MNRQDIEGTLKDVIDPEVGINVVDLGLIYDVEITGNDVHVRMMMTSVACPLSALLESEVQEAIHRGWPEAGDVTIEIVWEPSWTVKRMSPAARAVFGITDH